MLEVLTNRDKPSAASQAANTSKIIGSILVKTKWVDRIVRVIITNKESISPSRHKSDDIKCDRYMNKPTSAIVKANIIFI